jgi:hypothetical protein
MSRVKIEVQIPGALVEGIMPDGASLCRILGINGRMTLLYRDVLLLSLYEIRPRQRLRSFPLQG